MPQVPFVETTWNNGIVQSLELTIAPPAVDETGHVWILDFGKQKHHPLAHEYMNGLLHNMTH